MSPRREGREAAIQLLYSVEANPPGDEPVEFHHFWSLNTAGRIAREFAESLVNGLLPLKDEIDARLVPALENWELHRLETVDRAVLRLAIYEMWYCPDTPPLVAMNEAIELAKRFGTPDSPRFVNGVLDRLKADLTRPLRGGV
jgi:transcription antitermination protein NusB